MRQVNGVAMNINTEIIGKVTKRPPNRFMHSDLIWITKSIGSATGNCTAIITSDDFKGQICKRLKDTPIIYRIQNTDEFKEGDAILIKPTGNINIIYEKESTHNAIMVTERCNCACIMCPQEIRKQEDNKTDFNLKLISLMDKSTKSLALTGGEPTLVGDDLFKILIACKEKLPDTPVIILTNGILFSNFEYTKKLALLEHPDLTIAVAFYADVDNMHDYIVQSKAFYKMIQGLYNLALLKQRVEIRIVITAINYKRLPNIAEFIYRNFPFVMHIAFMGMETRELAEKNIDLVWVDPHDYMPYLKKAVDYLDRTAMNVSIYNQQLCVLPKDLWSYSRKSISSWKNIYLEECKLCSAKDECGGLFSSSEYRHSDYIKRL